jgi:predicted dehydrogenase
MFRTLIVGLGRAGARLHLPVLTRARLADAGRDLFDRRPFVAYDPYAAGPEPPGTVIARSLDDAAEMADPTHTVVHVCTPPTVRVDVMESLALLGYRRIVVEKPLALDDRGLEYIEQLRRRHGLHLAVVAPWLDSALTARVEGILHEGRLGELASISVLQRKSRFTRTLAGSGHPTAFDVEMPHAVGVALRLAGEALVRNATCEDMKWGELVVERMGRAALDLEHHDGVRTAIESDMTSPTRVRRIVLQFRRGTVVGHYASSEDDQVAHLATRTDGHTRHTVFPDDALLTFMLRTYEHFASARQSQADLALNCAVVRLLVDAKRVCGRPPAHLARGIQPVLVPSGVNGHRALPREATGTGV